MLPFKSYLCFILIHSKCQLWVHSVFCFILKFFSCEVGLDFLPLLGFPPFLTSLISSHLCLVSPSSSPVYLSLCVCWFQMSGSHVFLVPRFLFVCPGFLPGLASTSPATRKLLFVHLPSCLCLRPLELCFPLKQIFCMNPK